MTVLTGVFRVTQDAEIRYTGGGQAVAGVSLAYKCGSKKNAEGFYPSQFIEASLWEKRAESLAPYLKKGTKLWAVIEEVRIETFEKRDNGQGFKLVGRIGPVELMGDGNRPAESGGPQAPRQSAAPAERPAVRQAPPPSGPGGFDDMDDDIPF